MKLSKLMGRTIKETPKDVELPSHKFLIRAGFVRQYASGIYALLPLAKRVITKIEKIIREEMDAVEGQEISMSCLATADLWTESGRYQAIGKDMFRLKDRNDKALVLNMTHEEPVVFLARTELTSYKQFPAMVYQIQTKYRDEPRPRGGLIRLREFSMKDAYSFHTNEEEFHDYYMRVHEAYMKVFRRVGLKNFVSVLSDNGMFGGNYSHEFQLLVPAGEDKLISCNKCDYKANLEIAKTKYQDQAAEVSPLETVATPQITTIEALCAALKIEAKDTAKAVLFQDKKSQAVVAFVRGDLQIVDKKIQNLAQRELFPAKPEVISAIGAVAGSTGPKGLDLKNTTLLIDTSLLNTKSLVTGANKADLHYKNFNLQRDFLNTLSEEEKNNVIVGDLASVRAGDACPECDQGALSEERGIEIGNIFHLGTKYSQAMGYKYLAADGKHATPLMGCYGIGVTRLLPSVIEEHHDDRGIIFPISIAPFEVHLCALNLKEDGVKEKADQLYVDLKNCGVEILYDDRDEKAGSQFADADLMGIPFRIVVSPKTLGQGSVEFSRRDKKVEARLVALETIGETLQEEINKEYALVRSGV